MFLELLNSWAVSFDLPILDWIQAKWSHPCLDLILPWVTLLGEYGAVWIACALLLLLNKKHRRAGLGMGIALLMGLVVCNMLLKPAVERIRPYDFQLEHFGREIALLIEAPRDFSFPSGHTIAAFEACTVLLLSNKKLAIPAVVLAVAIAFSRLYLYVHYPTDVIASVILGTLFGIIAYLITHKIKVSLKGKYLAK